MKDSKQFRQYNITLGTAWSSKLLGAEALFTWHVHIAESIINEYN